MMMHQADYNVVYVDRRARRDRVQHRDCLLPSPISSGPESSDGNDEGQNENEEVIINLQCLLSAFNSVTICTTGTSCVSVLSDVDRNDPTPTLVLLDIPWQPQPEEDIVGHEGRHDSGIAADMLYGLPLLKFICNEVDALRMSGLVVPVAFLTNREVAATNGTLPNQTHWATTDKERCCEERELKCIDNGAVDVLISPVPKEKAKAMYMHCYRARKNVQKSRKVSWVGIDEQKPAREASDYAYLREKMYACFYYCALYMRVSPGSIEKIKNAIGSWDFSAHDFSDEELVHCAKLMLEHALEMPEVEAYRISSDRIVDFLTASRAAYNPKIPYHNFRHVVDVLQAIFYFLLQLRVLPPYVSEEPMEIKPPPARSLSKLLTPLDALTLLIVAIGHDVGHPGVNNAFLITLKAPLAQVYNDRSVLESFHCAAFSQVLQRHWPKTRELRKSMIDMILATDMGLHFDYMGRLEDMKEKVLKEDGMGSLKDKAVSDYRTLVCALLIKCADISNVARTHECSAQWAKILIEEFARQASMESDLGIPSSLVAPPDTGSVLALAKSQVGFMTLFAMPLFVSLSEVVPEMQFSVDVLTANKAMWQVKITSASDEIANNMSGCSNRSASASVSASVSDNAGNRQGGEKLEDRRLSGSHGGHVLGPVVMESSTTFQSSGNSGGGGGGGGGSETRSNVLALKSGAQASAEQPTVTVVVTQPKTLSPNPHAVLDEKRPTHQHSSEHLSAQEPPEQDIPDRPRSSPPDLGDHSSEHSCSKGCCGPTTIVSTSTMQRRPSSFFKRVKLWKSWRKETGEA
ncbi:HD-domain/PDEase-like protein [Choiromyces venosus 120613-1]|uniref:Phosphodiesterase n=1 Tax=Choiromyces venosus 120613-1 TaxID=1336337 RepID=A0A3N4K5K1_9PEZI|nr:HD-domain/PDEase-like protein [Choiromyces venosus 120613-1]